MKMFKMFRWATKPSDDSGIHMVRVPKDPTANPRDPATKEWVDVHDPPTMESHTLDYLKQHFSMAKSTPFASEPLLSQCGYDGLSPFAEQVLQGTADLSHLPIPVQGVMENMKAMAPPMPTAFLGALNGLSIWAGDIGNAYLEARTNEKKNV